MALSDKEDHAMKKKLVLLVAMGAVFGCYGVASADVILSATDFGYYTADSSYVSPGPAVVSYEHEITSYMVSYFSVSSWDWSSGIFWDRGVVSNNYFVFTIPNLTDPIVSAELRVTRQGVSSQSTQHDSITYTLFDVLTPIADLTGTPGDMGSVHVDLEGGNVYGSTTILVSGIASDVLSISFSSAGLTALNNALGEPFAIGGSITEANPSLTWVTGDTLKIFDTGASTPSPVSLVLKTSVDTVVPVPPAIWLLGSGLVGLAAVRRKFKK